MSYTTTEVNIENIKKPKWKNQYDRDEAFIEKSDIVEKDYWKGYNILLKEN